MPAKNRLVVIVGAGASLEFGFPSVARVGTLLEAASVNRFPLEGDSTRGIYHWIRDEVENHWRSNMKPAFVRPPNFEEVMYAIFELRALFPKGLYTAAVGALARARPDLPATGFLGRPPRQFDAEALDELGVVLADAIVNEFRERSRMLEASHAVELSMMCEFFEALSTKYELAIVSLNYDDIAWRTAGVEETGFRPDGRFDDVRLLNRPDWPCFLHLHGSVHFDMRVDGRDLHAIAWQADLTARFNQNSFGRSGIYTTEGHVLPQSVLVAGYGKTQQILRYPFRTYYSELDRLIARSDALLCLGYGFGDEHLNAALARYHDGRHRKIVLIDYAERDWMTAGGGAEFGENRTVVEAMRTFGNDAGAMTALGSRAPDTAEALLLAREFELSNDPDRPLAIWFNGMLEACRHAPKVLKHLG